MNNKIVDLGSKSKIDDDYIKDLEHDMDMLATMVLDLRKENKKIKGNILPEKNHRRAVQQK